MIRFLSHVRRLCLLVFLIGINSIVMAAEIKVAVASNFMQPAKALVKEYEAQTKHQVVLLVGSTGKHTAQISNGLRADVFMAADSARPKWLEQNGFAIEGSRFTYAVGRLALWWPDKSAMDADALAKPEGRLAIANPKLAPYGKAAIESLRALGVYEQWRTRLVQGENVAQAYQFVYTGNADLGLFAWSQLRDGIKNSADRENIWLVPANLHSPIEQQAVLLSKRDAAVEFHAFLQSEKALELIEQQGYDTP